MRRRAIAAAVAVGLSLFGCQEPNLKITVKLPDGYSRDSTKVFPGADGGTEALPLIVELAVYAPSELEGIDCEKIAWGDVPTLALRSARVFNAQLVPEATDALDATASVRRQGKKFAVALGAFTVGALGITLRDAVLAGCTEIGDIDGDTAIAVETVRTATILSAIVDRNTLFLSAEVPAAGASPIVVTRAGGPRGFTSSTALHLEFSGDDGAGVATSVRFSVVDGRGLLSSQPVLGPASAVDAELTIDSPGLFTVIPRLRYQQGDDLPALDGLAYRTLASSDGSSALATELGRTAEVAIGPIGATAAPTFVLAGPPSGPGATPLFVTLLRPHLATSGEIEFVKTELDLVDEYDRPLGRPIRLLGFFPISGGSSAVFAATPFLQPPPQPPLPAPPPVRARLVASAGAADPEVNLALDGLDVQSQIFAPTAAAIGPCDDATPALLLHLGEQEPSPIVSHFWLYDQAAGLSHGVGVFTDALDPMRPRLIGGLQQSLCVDDWASPTARHRLLFLRPPGNQGVGWIFDLGGSATDISQIPATPAEAVLPELLRESVMSTARISIDGQPERQDLLAAVGHNDQFEINIYAAGTGTTACTSAANCFEMDYRNTLYSSYARHDSSIYKVDTAFGHLTSKDRLDLALLVVRVSWVGPAATPLFAAEIGLVSGDLIARTATVPLACIAPEACKIYVGDVNDDQIDELLLVHLDGEPPVWHAKIIRFAP